MLSLTSLLLRGQLAFSNPSPLLIVLVSISGRRSPNSTANTSRYIRRSFHFNTLHRIFLCKVFDVCVSVDKMQFLAHPSKTYHTHLHAMIRTHNLDPNTVLGFRYMCKVVKPNVKYPTSNLMFGIFSDIVL